MKQGSVVAVTVVLLLMSSVAFSQDNRRTEKFSIPVTVTGALIGQCGNFDVLSDWVALLSGTILYDKSGVAVQTIQHYRLIGESIYYNSANPAKRVFGGPAEHELDRIDGTTGIVYVSGPSFKIRVPGYGLIFAETGHLVFDETTGQLLFNSGHNQFYGQDLAAVCNYLK
ncbi:MAG: hypothetical protein LAO23_05980 [Acidobacteriia bacterium]|nr:hypothetical protein [Terriglobia bacterium]